MAFPEDMIGKVICGTGHRPDKLGGYNGQLPRESEYEARVVRLFSESKPKAVITGMAQGWDMVIANAALSLDIPVHAYIPFTGHSDRWPISVFWKYEKILSLCATMRTICPDHSPMTITEALHARSYAMVDDSEFVLACWDGSNSGTSKCIDYARKQNKPLLNVFDFIIKPVLDKETE